MGTLFIWQGTNSPRYGHESLSWVVMTVPGLCALSLGTKAAVREIHARQTAICQGESTAPGEDAGHVG